MSKMYDSVKEDEPWEYLPGDTGHKMYVLVRGDLSKSQQAVQAGHAVAQCILEGNHCNYNLDYSWKNGTLVFLKVRDLTDLLVWREKVRCSGLLFSEFKEFDMGMETTAIATVGNIAGELLKNLPLL